MTVSELVEFLKTQPQELQVAYRCYSEKCLLVAEDIKVSIDCVARPDGWIHDNRPDKPKQKYLLFPGN